MPIVMMLIEAKTDWQEYPVDGHFVQLVGVPAHSAHLESQ